MSEEKSRGIVLENCSQVTVENNSFLSLDTAIEATNSSDITARGNRIISPQALEIFSTLEQAIAQLEIDADARHQYEKALSELREAAGTKSFVEKYMAFIEITANHIAVFNPIVGHLLHAMG